MSRIGRMPIVVPAGVDVKIDGQHVTVKGGKAELSLDVHPDITVKLEDGQITVTRPSDDKNHRSLHGLFHKDFGDQRCRLQSFKGW